MFEPTDEQIDALLFDVFRDEAMFDHDDEDGLHVAESEWDAVKSGLARRIREHAAFQAIIRAAQAEALREHAEHVRSNHIPHAMSGIQAIVAALEVRADQIESDHDDDRESRRDDHDRINDDGWNDIKENWE